MRKRKIKQSEWLGLLFILPSLIGVSVFILMPFIDVIKRSFIGAMNEVFVGISNYQMVLKNTAFKLAATNTIWFMLVCIPLLLILSLLLSQFLFRQGKIGNYLKMAYLVPMAIPVASVVLLWRILFHRQGFLNGFINIFGIEAIDWMNSEYAFGVLVFSYIWKNVGYNIVLWLAGLSGISTSIYEAARVDGATERKIFFRITLPNLKATMYTIIVLSILNSFKVFREAYLVAGDYPHQSMYLLQHIFNNWFREMSFDKMSAAAVMVAFVIGGLILILQKSWDLQE
jgi:ABC-type sugar transport systems, permease components